MAAVLRLAADAGQHAFTAHDLGRSCTAWIEAQLPVDVRRSLHHAINERRSGRAIAGLTVLLALCGWINGGDEGARLAVIGAMPQPNRAHAPQGAMLGRRDARRLSAAEAPELIALVHAICRRAGLRRMPQVYLLPAERSMNAYALGTPDEAVITLTGGLLHGMSRDEVAAIIAHEIAHIRNGDAATMALAAGLNRTIRLVSAAGLSAMAARPWSSPALPLMGLLQAAPAIAELLCLALSRIRELAADAFALDLISDPATLASALEKLERHHIGADPSTAFAADDAVTGYLRSHPSTDQRVSFVHVLA
ncbi:MAG: M48 family metalloprotease [Hyphomicrobium sp.]